MNKLYLFALLFTLILPFGVTQAQEKPDPAVVLGTEANTVDLSCDPCKYFCPRSPWVLCMDVYADLFSFVDQSEHKAFEAAMEKAAKNALWGCVMKYGLEWCAGYNRPPPDILVPPTIFNLQPLSRSNSADRLVDQEDILGLIELCSKYPKICQQISSGFALR